MIPDVRCEVAFETGPDDPSPAWRDLSPWLLVSEPVSITRGRGDEYAQVQPSSCSMTLNNSDGRFTAGLATSPYYPNVKIGRRLRVAVRGVGDGNFVANPTFETNLSGWSTLGAIAIARTSTRAWTGAWSMQLDWSISGGLAKAFAVVTGLTIGRVYTLSAYHFVSTGGSAVSMNIDGIGLGSSTSTTNAWQRVSTTFTATATSHTINFYRFSVGAAFTSWVDGVQLDEGSGTRPYTAAAPPISYRFTGHVDEWPLEWAPVAKWAKAAVTATDRLKRLGQIAEFTNVVSEEILYDAPAAYFTLGEEAEATAAGDTSTLGQGILVPTQVGAGGTLEFGAGTGPATDGLSAPVLTPASVSAGLFLLAASLPDDVGFSAVTLRVSALTSSANTQTAARLLDGYGSYLTLDTVAGKLVGTVASAFSGVLASVTSAASVNDGLTHSLAASLAVSAGTVTLTIFIDGVSAGTATYAASSFPLYTRLAVGGTTTGRLFTGTLSHVAAFPTALTAARLLVQHLAGATGFAGESSDARLARYARWAGIPDTAFEAGSSASIAHIDTTGLAPVQVMQDVAATEGGVLFVAGNGALTLHARSHRYSAPAAATLAAGDYGDSTSFVANDLLLANDVTVSRAGGITYRAIDAASIADYGTYRKAVQLLTTSDGEVVDAANWIALRQGQPAPRVPDLALDLLTNAAIRSAVLALEIGHLVTLTGLPSQAPTATVSLFVEGWTETITISSWSLAFNTSPSNDISVWVLQDPVYGAIDTSNRIAY